MSKFDFEIFRDDIDFLAVSKERYSKEEAIAVAQRELCGHDCSKCKEACFFGVSNAFVRWRVGWNDEHERCAGWWLETQEGPRCCPVWMFHVTDDPQKDVFPDWYDLTCEYTAPWREER